MSSFKTIKRDKDLFKSFEKCKFTTKYYAKSFYFSSFFLPRMKRYAAYSIYDFCRYADNIMYSQIKSPQQKKEEIDKLRKKIDLIYNNDIDIEDRFYALSFTINKYSIPKKLFYDLLTGVEFDETDISFKTFEELRNYCYHVASVVGLMMTYIFGVNSYKALKYAESLGIAMQLTNILRDIKEDMLMNRFYLPEEDFIKFNYSITELKNQTINENFIKMMKFEVERARYYYNNSLNGIPFITDDGSRTTVVIMLKTYSEILTKIENSNYNIFDKRVYLSKYEKVLQVIKYFFSFKKNRNNTIIPLDKTVKEI